MRLNRFIYKKAAAAAFIIMLGALLTACGGRSSTASSGDTIGTAGAEETSAEEPQFEGSYEESVAVSGVNEEASPYYGIMYVSVLDVNGNVGESKTVYSFRDKSDPENAWSVTGLEIGYIEAEITAGADVAILFHGDVIRDGENLEFIAILPDGEYAIKRAEGTTLSNTMSAFTLSTAGGAEIAFLKDNCRIEDGAMNTDSGDNVVVYYADGGELGNFPIRIYAAK